MTATHRPIGETAPPDAALVHLSGRRRGTTEFLSEDRVVITSAPDGGVDLTTSVDSSPGSLATLERRGHTFALTTSPGSEVWINGEKIDELEARAGARERIIATASRSVVFLQGAYGFTEPSSGRALRFAISLDGSPTIGPGGQPALTVEGDGPEVEILYTGTGFVATDDGLIVTNRHVAEPWLFYDEAKLMTGQGLTPVMRRFVGYLPGEAEPFDVSLVVSSNSADVAVLRCQTVTAGLPALLLDDRPLDAGDEVVVLGYPTGIRAMIARSQREILPVLEARGEVDFWEVAQVLADGGHIAPLATQGIVGQITAGSVVYDANTTHGGSGGPVIGLDGRVVAVNSAILPDFTGSNFGVPAAEALRLLEDPAEQASVSLQ